MFNTILNSNFSDVVYRSDTIEEIDFNSGYKPFAGTVWDSWVMTNRSPASPNSPDSATGFKAASYFNSSSGELVVAFAGTDFPLFNMDIASDIQMLRGKIPDQYQSALVFLQSVQAYAEANNIPADKITLTGHSLGGSLAQLMSLVFGYKAETFDAVGVGDLVDPDVAAANAANIQSNFRFGDPVYLFTQNAQIGTLRFMVKNADFFQKTIQDNTGREVYVGQSPKDLHQISEFSNANLSEVAFLSESQLGYISNGNFVDVYRLQKELALASTTAGPRDPLSIDVNADGAISTVPLSAGVHFDMDGNGFAENVGWIGSADALIVRDINGDGLITTGAELLGDATVLPSGNLAAGAFEALAALDSNLDGKVDVNDPAFASLRAWRDANGNGAVDQGELKTLVDAGVLSFNTGFSTVSVVDQGGNIVKQIGSFVRTDGSVGVAQGYAFSVNEGISVPADTLPLSESVALLPNVRGYGNVYSLQQAMMRDATLPSVVNGLAASSDMGNFLSSFEAMLWKWAGVESVDPNSRGANINARQLAVLEAFSGSPFVGAAGENPNIWAAVILNQAYSDLVHRLSSEFLAQSILKSFWSSVVFSSDGSGNLAADYDVAVPALQQLMSGNLESDLQLVASIGRIIKDFDLPQGAAFASLKSSIALVMGGDFGLALTVGVSGKFDGGLFPDVMIGTGNSDLMMGGAGNDTLSGGEGDDTLVGGPGDDTLAGGGGSDTYIFNRGDGQDTFTPSGWRNEWPVQDTLALGAGISPDEVRMVRQGNDLVLSLGGGDGVTLQTFFESYTAQQHPLDRVTFADGTVWTRNYLLTAPYYGTEGADWVAADPVGEALYGLAGDDSLMGWGGNDLLVGGPGNDTLSGGEGDDTLVGGPGDDTLAGGGGSDTYIFNRGDGQDTFTPSGWRNEWPVQDTLALGAGISPDEVRMVRQGNDLVLSLGGGDGVTLQTFFESYTAQQHPLDRVTFADGTVWTRNYLLTAPYYGTEGADWVAADPVGEALYGLAGDDSLMGWGGNDLLVGGPGNDTLSGGEGDDTLVGGPGDDTLAGGGGSDTYIFNRGDGQDTFTPSGWRNEWPVQDTLALGAGISPDEVRMVRQGNDLVLSLGGGDGVTLQAFFESYTAQQHPLDRVTFADGTVWTRNYLLTAPYYGTEGADWVAADPVGETLYGLAGDDTLVGSWGSDTLIGGAGNDTLSGGEGSDRFVFGRGDGQDVIYAGTTQISGKTDQIVYQGDISHNDLWFARSGNSMVINVIGTQDQVTVSDWFVNAANPVQQVIAGDGYLLNQTGVEQMAAFMSTQVQPVSGPAVLPQAYADLWTH